MMNRIKFLSLPSFVLLGALIVPAHTALADDHHNAPSLVVTSDPLPENLRKQIYSKPVQVRTIKPAEVINRDYFTPTQTIVGAKIQQLSGDLGRIQNDVAGLAGSLNALQRSSEERAAEYYANIATINTQLQAGTTPGNPRLVSRLGQAEGHLDNLTNAVAQYNGTAQQASALASEVSFLLEETRAAYGISGAVEEDHVDLAQLEDSINNTAIVIQRVLNTVNDDITRTSTYLSSERENLRILSLAVANGDFYGRSLANRPFSSAPAYGGAGMQPASYSPSTPAPSAAPPALSGPRPLAKIKFDRADVNYEEPVYLAVNEALKRYPNARFDLVAVTPTQGNAAEVAIESTKARRNAEKVLRTLTQMGLEQERVDLSYSENPQASTNEVHLFVK